MADIKFYRCSSEQFSSNELVTTSNGYIFFVTDAQKIYVSNGTENPDCYAVGNSIVDVNLNDTELIFTDANGQEHKFDIGIDEQTSNAIEALKGLLNEDGELNISLQYQSAMPDGQTVGKDIGGIKGTTTAKDLKKKTLSEVLDDLIFPTLYPTLGETPTTSISHSYANKIYQVGSPLPQKADITVTFKQGKVTNWQGSSVDDGTTANGDPIFTQPTEFKATSESCGDVTYKAKYNYNAGTVFKNNKGTDEKSVQRGAGTTAEASFTVNYTLPWFASTVDDKNLTELPLVKWGSGMVFGKEATDPRTDNTCKPLVACNVDNGGMQMLNLPKQISTLKYFDTGSGKWVDATDMFTVRGQENEVEINSTKYTYYKYTYNAANRGALYISFKSN